ncbi:MAG: 2-dehydropantoate 2-reductase, partial [Myxococcota bacterium]
MRIAVLGAGGLGGYLGAVLYEAGHEVVLVTRGEHFDVIAERGLEVSEGGRVRRVLVPCSLGSDLDGQFDIAFVTVKTYALETIAPLAAHLARRGAAIIPLVNGVDASELLSREAGDRVTPGVAYVTAFRTRPGTVERIGTHQRLVFGPHTTLPGGQSLLEAAFAETPVDIEVVSDVRPELWRKMAVVC